MKSFLKRDMRGFTLVEIVIVVGIIAILSAIILTSLNQARTQSRDKVRLTDIKQLELTFKLYQEAYNGYPTHADYDIGVEIGDNARVATDLVVLQSNLPKDPKFEEDDFGYIYDTDFDCTAAGQTVIYVKEFETLTSEANADDVCGADAGDDATGSEYIILLD